MLDAAVGRLAVAVTERGLILLESLVGDNHAFTVAGQSYYTFVYVNGETPTLVCMTGDINRGYVVEGVAEAFGPDLYFSPAELKPEGIVVDVSSDNYLRNLRLDLGSTLAQLALVGVGTVYQVSLYLSNRTRYLVDENGGSRLMIFRIGHQVYGVDQNPDVLQVLLLDQGPDRSFMVKQIVGSYPLPSVRAHTLLAVDDHPIHDLVV
jgi:hypothetical protein